MTRTDFPVFFSCLLICYLQPVTSSESTLEFNQSTTIVGKALNEPITVPEKGLCQYDIRARYKTIARHMCLPTQDDRCLDTTFDIFNLPGIWCAQPDFFSDEVLSNVSLVDSSSMMKLLQKKDAYGRPWCMISMFYAQGCPFSGRLARYFNALPKVFPCLKAVAVDATEFSRLNSRYGISGTPTVILWVNGVGVARMRDEELSMNGLKEFVESTTGLEARHGVPETASEPLKISVNELQYVLLIIGSWGMTIMGSFYYFLTSEFGKQTIFRLFPRQREMYEQEMARRPQRIGNRREAVPAPAPPNPQAEPQAEPQPEQHPHEE